MVHSGTHPGTRDVAQRHLIGVEALLRQVDLEAVDRVVERLVDARMRAATIFVAGNGGSAATASHWTADVAKATRCIQRPHVRAVCLSDNVPWVTALANDEGFERIFAGQLECLGRPGDVLVVISASGNSANLVQAVELAQRRGLHTVGILGFDGGILKDRVDDVLFLASEPGAYALVEDGHAVLCHVLTTCLTERAAR
jgi:D-sedoheptulose 7-phosphate isomerase